MNQNLSSTFQLFKESLHQGHGYFLALCVLFMPVNWLIESIKWKILVEPFEKINLFRSVKAILSGISVAILTPNRIGEYGGRMLMVEAKNNWKAVISTLISSYAQNIWNIGVGLIAAMLFLYQAFSFDDYLFYSGISFTILILFVLITIYYNVGFITKLLYRWQRLSWVSKAIKHLTLLDKYDNTLLTKVLLGSLFRYMIYFLQYYFILRFFGLEINFIASFIGIGTIFLLQTSLPLPPLLGFIARGEIALMVWEKFEFNDLSILGASYSLWFLNLIIPSILGNIIIILSNLWQTLGFDKEH